MQPLGRSVRKPRPGTRPAAGAGVPGQVNEAVKVKKTGVRERIRERFGGRQLGPLEVTSLTDVLDRLDLAPKDGEVVRLGAMLDVTGKRSFGALLLVPGLLVLSPISGVPGVPTLSGVLVVLIASQILMGRKHFWLPQWLLNRGVSCALFSRALRLLRPVARVVDRLLRPRLGFLVDNRAVYVVAVVCILVAVTMPPLELVPFAATAAGIAITSFGLALIGRDGLLTLIALGFCAACLAVVLMAVF